jgi:small-conductance mechanosensitive channel
MEIGVSFDTDLDKAMAIIQEEAMKHPAFIDGREEEEKERNEPAVRVMVRYISTYSVVIRAYLWAKDSPESFVYLTDMYKIIFERFRQEGIEVPLPYTHVLMHPSAENETSPPKPE